MDTIEKIKWLADHGVFMAITHNEHKLLRQGIESYLKSKESDDVDFVSLEDKAKILETDEVWDIQHYPNTPIAFHYFIGSSLDMVVDKMFSQYGGS